MTWKKLVITLICKLKLNTSVNCASFDNNYHFSLPLCEKVWTTSSYSWWILRFHVSGYQTIRQGKVQSKLTDINIFILNSQVKVLFKICQKHLFLGSYLKTKFGNSCIGFFQRRKLTIYEMTYVRKPYICISKFVKTYNTITCWKVWKYELISADSFIKNNLTLKFKFLLWKKVNFWFQKTPFRYVFAIAYVFM